MTAKLIHNTGTCHFYSYEDDNGRRVGFGAIGIIGQEEEDVVLAIAVEKK